ncbi:IS1-like element transposase [Candidatus Enterovibrio escicola]|uniref:IS1-like element transposase n=1 Tax=Candidatus Enterovibrio escicola TaxID=1927127 RepID=UPI001CC24B97
MNLGVHQGYRYQACYQTFQLGYTCRAYQAERKAQTIELAMNNSGIRDSSRVLHININLVIIVLKNLHTLFNYIPS